MLTVGSCFSGIGGLELGLEKTGGFKTAWQIENDPYAAAVLKKHWPDVKRYGDITTISPAQLERVDVICGGYPCQPFSFAGKRNGESDARHLWPDMHRIIRSLRPRYVLLENVPGHLSMGFGRVLGDLAECGYDAEWQVLSAAGVGAPHLRRRVFILAHANGVGSRGQDRNAFHEGRKSGEAGGKGIPENAERKNGSSIRHDRSASAYVADAESREIDQRKRGDVDETQDGWESLDAASYFGSEDVANAAGIGKREPADETNAIAIEWNSREKFSRRDWWKSEPNVGRVAHGVPSRVDRLKCLGNAVVPQVAQKVGEMILQYEKQRRTEETPCEKGKRTDAQF